MVKKVAKTLTILLIKSAQDLKTLRLKYQLNVNINNWRTVLIKTFSLKSNWMKNLFPGFELRGGPTVGPVLLVLVRASRRLRVLLLRHGHRRICQAAQVQTGISRKYFYKNSLNSISHGIWWLHCLSFTKQLLNCTLWKGCFKNRWYIFSNYFFISFYSVPMPVVKHVIE
jgi:hypothetical protein